MYCYIYIVNAACTKTKICIAKCPQTFWSYYMGKSNGVKQFCDSRHIENNNSMAQHVTEKICPPYIVPSESVGGFVFQSMFNWESCETWKKLNAILIELQQGHTTCKYIPWEG